MLREVGDQDAEEDESCFRGERRLAGVLVGLRRGHAHGEGEVGVAGG